MYPTLKNRLTQFWSTIQNELFPFISNMNIEMTPMLQRVTTVLEMLEIERFVPQTKEIGRKPINRWAFARAFVAKCVLNLPTTQALIDRLQVDRSLRQLCGFSVSHRIPGKHAFSRAFAEFAQIRLADRTHESLINTYLGDQLIGHIARDSTAIEAREKPAIKKSATKTSSQKPFPRGRPKKNEIREPKPTAVLVMQQKQTLAQMTEALPTACDISVKQSSQGFKYSWRGYKLHIDTADGDIPISAILTSASVHDSQVMMPLMLKTSARVDYLYDLADAAYCSPILRNASKAMNHVPLIDHNPRRGEKKPFDPPQVQRYKARSAAERVNGYLKDHYGGTHVWVRGHVKVASHLMFGIAVIAAMQLLRLIQ